MQKPFSKLLGLATGAYATRRSFAGGKGHRGPDSDHFDGTVFRNQNPAASAGKGFGDFLRWQRTSHRTPWPQWVDNHAHPNISAALGDQECRVTFVNHITFLLQFPGLNVLTDPVYSERVSPVQWAGPRRVRAPGIAFDALPHIDLVLVSHNHYDHLDLATLQRLEQQHQPVFLTGLGNAAFLQENGLRQVHEFDWWQGASHRRLHCTFVPAQHWSGRNLGGRNRTLWGGFVLQTAGWNVYFAGDTGYWNHFTQIRERCGSPDIALLPIGAYEPRWFMQDQHMNPEEAVRAHIDLHAALSIATHFGCFQLTDEGIDEPLRELELARQQHRIGASDFRALEVGESLLLPRTARANRAA